MDFITRNASNENIIVLDATFESSEQSWLHTADAPWKDKVMVFKNFKDLVLYSDLRTSIAHLKALQSEKRVLHVTMDGGRGVDFAMNSPALVIIIKDVRSLSEFRQLAGRGARKHSQTCKVFICVPHGGFLAGTSREQVETKLTTHQAYLADQDIVKMKICERLNGKNVGLRNVDAAQKAVDVLNDEDKMVSADESDPNKKQADKNYGVIVEGFPTVMPGLVSDFEDNPFFE